LDDDLDDNETFAEDDDLVSCHRFDQSMFVKRQIKTTLHATSAVKEEQ
jgi:hypothetical protein